MTRHRHLASCRAGAWLLGALLSAGVAPVSAQMELAVFQASVKDEAGKPLEGVTVRLRDLQRGRETTVKSDKGGRVYRRGLQAGEYEMTVEKEGYQPITDKVRLTTGDARPLDFTLAASAPAGAGEFGDGVKAFNAGDFAAAAKAFEAAVAKAPDLAEVRVNLALAYLRLGRAADAVAELERASALGQPNAGILFQLGGAYVELQELDKAAASLEKGLALNGNLQDPLAYEAQVTLGAVYFAQGRNDPAAAAFDKALAVKPGAAAPTLGLAKVHFSRGDVDKALPLFEAVVQTHPGTAEATQAEAFIKELKKGAVR